MKINRTMILFFCILIFIFLGALSEYLIFIALILSALFAVIIGNQDKSAYIPLGIMYLLVFQNLCIGIGAHISSNTSELLKFLTQIPFMVIFIIWLVSQIKYKQILNLDKTRKMFIFLIVCIGFSFLTGRGSILSILINLRNLTTFFWVYEIGKNNLDSKHELNIFITKFLALARMVLYVGIILLIFGYDLYKIIGIKEVYIAKGAPIEGERLDGRFYTTLISKQYSRMGSIYYEPVNLAYFFAAAVLVTLFYKWTEDKKKIFINRVLMILGLILTFGKGGYLLVGGIIMCLCLEKFIKCIWKNSSRRLVQKLTLIVSIILIAMFSIYYYKNIGAAASPHFWGIILTWNTVMSNPIGYGIGTGGNMAQVFNGKTDNWFETGGETALMSFMYQIGIQGIIALLLCFSTMSIKTEGKSNFERIFVYLPYILLGISLLQDNTFTPQCITIFMLLQGAAKANFENDENLISTENQKCQMNNEQ